MKTLKLLVPVFLLFIAATVAVSCSDDETNSSSSVITTPNLEDIIASDSGHMTWHEYYSKILAKAEEGNSAEATAMATWAKKQLYKADSLTQVLADSLGSNYDPNSVQNFGVGFAWHTINYKSIDEYGKDITLSALVAYPYGSLWNPHPDNLVIGCHCTITSDKERPTNYGDFSPSFWLGNIAYDTGMLVTLANTLGAQALVVIPDYQGYGATKTRIHPYLQEELTARQVIDGALQGKLWYEENRKSLDDGWGTVSVGYSQGGAVAMAVHRYVEEKGLSSELHFKGSVCGDGPYDPLATVKSYISEDKVYMPVALALMMDGMCNANSNLKGIYTPEDFLTEQFVNTNILEYIENKEMTTDDIQERLIKWKAGRDGKSFLMQEDSKGHYYTIDQILRPEVIEYLKDGTLAEQYKDKLIRLSQALEDNNIIKGWKPKAPVMAVHSTRDEVVPYVNYTNAKKAFETTGLFSGYIFTFSDSYLHVETGTSFFIRLNYFVEKVLNDETPCKEQEIGDFINYVNRS